MPYISAIIVLVILSGIFSGTETSFTSISIIQKKELEESRKKSSRVALELVNNPSTLLTTILIGNNIVNILASSLATQYAIMTFGNRYVGYATGILTLVILIFGEITPKQIAITYNMQIATFMAIPVKCLTIALFPLVWFFRAISNLVTRVFCHGGKKGMDMQGLMHVIEAANEDGVVDDSETDMVEKVFNFSDTRVMSIMTPKVDMFSLPENLTIEEGYDRIVESGFSRIPIYEETESHDRITGMLLLRDVLHALRDHKEDLTLRDIAKDACFVPEILHVGKLFGLMKEKKIQFVIAVDEYGDLSGICTMEDVVEELFGEIYDEHEKVEPEDIVVINEEERRYLVQADCPFKDFEDYWDLEFDDEERIATVASYVVQYQDTLLKYGDVIETDAGVFKVRKMDGRRVEEFEFTLREEEDEE